MPSPFPGMDPYLEKPKRLCWLSRSVHRLSCAPRFSRCCLPLTLRNRVSGYGLNWPIGFASPMSVLPFRPAWQDSQKTSGGTAVVEQVS